ncbi:putative prophage LambdaBa01, membrane protein [Labilithrix luteola]|uniref:Putative prophage LambdaBa01, membrane protein n=1 Tax=Labilithrix luteola TaxID=1391654 RepID=A0A0K1QFR7_9BACT|nr:putative prophage LambdaBa01, membrane protein [Labilithrix luteola]
MGAQVGPQLEKVGKAGEKIGDSFGKLKDLAGNAASTLAGAFTGAVEQTAAIAAGLTKVGAIAAGGAIAYGVAALNNELEQTKISIGAILNAQGVSGGMVNAMSMSADIVKEMRRDATALPGEFKDLMSFFKLGATPGFQAGASTEQLEKMSANAMAAAAATGVQMDQAAREFAQLLQGRSGAHNVFGTMLGLTGDESKKFNAMSGADRLKKVETEIAKYSPAIDVFSNSFDALSSTMKDNAKNLLQKATLPLFDSVKHALATSNGWFDANQSKVEDFAEKAGEKLAYAFEWGRMKILEWYPTIRTFAENAWQELSSVWKRIEPMVARIGDVLKKTLADPNLFKKLEGVLQAYAAVKVGGGALSAGASTASALAPILTAAAGGSEAAGAAMATAAGPAALAIGAFAIAAVGAEHALTDSTSVFHGAATFALKDTTESAGRIGDRLSHLWTTLSPVADGLGTATLFVVDSFVKQAEAVVTLTDGYFQATEWFQKKVREMLPEWLRGDGEPTKVAALVTKQIGNHSDLLRPEKDSEPQAKKGAGGGGGGTTIQKVEIVVSSNQDPSRIARLTVDKLQDISRNPTSSRSVRNWGAARP